MEVETGDLGQQGRIICFFKTHLDAPFKLEEHRMDIPSSLNEKGLNEYILKLLEAQYELEDNVDQLNGTKFEFLINNEFLRGTLRSHALKHNLLIEETIEIWYTKSLQSPKEGNKQEDEDWIGCLALIGQFNGQVTRPIIAGLYNGSISVYSQDIQHLFRQPITQDYPIRAIASQENYLTQSNNNKSSSHLVYSACDDEILRIGVLQYEKHKSKVSVSYSELVDCIGSTSQLQCVDINILNSSLITSANFKGDVFIYSLTQQSLETASSVSQTSQQTSEDNEEEVTKSKKKKLSKKQLEPITTVEKVHNDKITNIFWTDSDRILTSSFDHHIKLYDVTKQQNIQDYVCKDSAVTAMYPTQSIILSGHEDNSIKQWDTREKQYSKTFKSHTSWISSIRTLESNQNIFLTTSYDHTAKLWDIRSAFPLFTLKTHHDKILAGIWNSDQTVITAGSDNQIVSHLFNGQE